MSANTSEQIDSYFGDDGRIVVPDGTTVLSFLERNVANWGESAAYRYLDFAQHDSGCAVGLTWRQLESRMRALGARLQQVAAPGDRVAVLAPPGVDYVIGFFAAMWAGAIVVPLFAPELPGHTERLTAVLADAQPTVVLTTTAAAERVLAFVRKMIPHHNRPRVIAVDAIPDSASAIFSPGPLATDDIAYLQYTSGSTGTPKGVEITHRAVCTNVVQMITSVGLDPNIRSVSWLPLYHDMGLLMIMFPMLCGGHITLMSPSAFVRRPYRWIKELATQSAHGRTFAAAPNFAFELTAQRGQPPAGNKLDLSNIAGLIDGAEPVSMSSIEKFYTAFAPYGLPATAVKPSYGLAEATLFVATIEPAAQPTAIHLHRNQLTRGYARRVAPQDPNAVPHVSCGRVARGQWAVITDSDIGAELPDGRVGEIWLHGDNLGRGYWGRDHDTEAAFRNTLHSRLQHRSHAQGAPANAFWLRTGDLGVYLNDELYIVGRIKDLVIIDGRNHYPHDIEATVCKATSSVRPGFIAAFSIPGYQLAGEAANTSGERLVIIAERAPGTTHRDPAPIIGAIRAAVSRQHQLAVADIKLVAAGSIPRTTSGKIARHTCRANYLTGQLAMARAPKEGLSQ